VEEPHLRDRSVLGDDAKKLQFIETLLPPRVDNEAAVLQKPLRLGRYKEAGGLEIIGPRRATQAASTGCSVFSDLSANRSKGLFDDVLKQLAVRSYVEDGLVMGGFYESNETTAIYNRSFRPFTPPVPFLLMRHGVISDWKFFLDNDDWLNRWTHRYGESGVRALAEELRRLPWRVGRAESHNK